jgi:hypothetical protein
MDRAKLTALSQAQIPAATKYDPARFESRISESRRAEEQARGQANQAERAAATARDAWKSLEQRYQARVQGVGGRG